MTDHDAIVRSILVTQPAGTRPVPPRLASPERLRLSVSNGHEAWPCFCARGGPRFDGTILQVSGKCLELLRALAESKGPLTVDELRRRVWPEYLAEEVTIRWTVKKLRGLLKEQVPLCEEPIVTRPEGGYVLTLR